MTAQRARRADRSRAFLGIDLGGTKAFVGVVLTDGTVLSRLLLSTREFVGEPAPLLDRLAGACHDAAGAAGLTLAEVAALGICVPGPLDPTRRTVLVAPNLAWGAVPVCAEMSRRLDGALPVYLENDVRAAALAEALLGAGRGKESLLAVFVGSGVGGGYVLRGHVHHGTHGTAGEIGHMVVQAGGPRCPCGRPGCLEAMAARNGLAHYVHARAARGERTVLSELLQGNLLALSSRELRLAIQQGDRLAIRAAVRSARFTGLAIGSAINLIDPSIVVVGGGIAEALGEQYVRQAAELARRQVLSPAAKETPVVGAVLGENAGLLGAALTAAAGQADGD